MNANMTTVKERIERLLRTTPGERVMRPNYGSNLYKLIDQRRDDNWVRDMAHEIYTAIRNSEPDIEIKKVRIQLNGDRASAMIELQSEIIDVRI